jgi:hypothetical protein
MRSMTTKATAAVKKAAPAKKAAQPRTRNRPAAAPPPEPAAQPSPSAADDTSPAARATPGEVCITFHGRTFPVIRPSDEQMALLLDIQNWARKLQTIQAGLSALPEGTPDTHPEVVKGQAAVQQALRRIGRMNTIVETIIPLEDWDAIQDGMAERLIKWQEFANLPYLILAAHNEADQMAPDNRAARRQQGRRAV